MKFTAFYNILLSLQLVPGIHEPKAQGQSSNPPETFQQIRQILTHIINGVRLYDGHLARIPHGAV